MSVIQRQLGPGAASGLAGRKPGHTAGHRLYVGAPEGTDQKCPFLGLLMPAVWNAPLVGWELAAYLGEGGFTWPVFGLNALYVFLGEAIVLLVLGTILYYALTARKLDQRLFSPS